jgi:ferredoxin, 2Fe-2S
MGRITFVAHDKTEHVATFQAGASLMQTAVDNAIPGIDADCGGSCACGTCHVIVDRQWFDKTGAPNDDEQQMLQMTPEYAETSRLACQVTITEAMDGMVVRLPEFQM